MAVVAEWDRAIVCRHSISSRLGRFFKKVCYYWVGSYLWVIAGTTGSLVFWFVAAVLSRVLDGFLFFHSAAVLASAWVGLKFVLTVSFIPLDSLGLNKRKRETREEEEDEQKEETTLEWIRTPVIKRRYRRPPSKWFDIDHSWQRSTPLVDLIQPDL